MHKKIANFLKIPTQQTTPTFCCVLAHSFFVLRLYIFFNNNGNIMQIIELAANKTKIIKKTSPLAERCMVIIACNFQSI